MSDAILLPHLSHGNTPSPFFPLVPRLLPFILYHFPLRSTN